MSQDSLDKVVGFFDGYRNGRFIGWAWRPLSPDHPPTIEVVVDGLVVGEAVASSFRPDLRAAGVGNGYHAFAIPLDLKVDRDQPIKVVVREKNGEPLGNGQAEIGGKPSEEDQTNEEFQAFVAAVLGQRPDGEGTPVAAELPPPINFIVYCPSGFNSASANAAGGPEYSYSFVAQAFKPVLERFGSLHFVTYPPEDVDPLYEDHLARGQTSLFLSFAPPHRTTLGLRCPTVPVIAWEYPTIPTSVWEDEIRHDWRWVLRQTGRVITLSHFAARAVKATMGTDFPVMAIPAPVFDRYPENQTAPTSDATPLQIEGFVVDTREKTFEVGMSISVHPDTDPSLTEVMLDGIVFTSVFAPKDGRKNWPDILTAFVMAFGQVADATLVLKMIGNDASFWWWEFHDTLCRLPKFACRVVVLSGFLDDDRYRALIARSHWVVNASRAEGLCLPLVEFMSLSRPAIAPAHTAMADYISPDNAVIIESDEEFCMWPQDPTHEFTTTRHRVSWSSLRSAFSEAYRIVTSDPDRYRAMSEAARKSMEGFCGDEVVSAALDSFLGLGRKERSGEAVSQMLVAD